MTEKWLSVLVGIYLIGMVLYGHYRGFIRQAVSAVSLILTLTAVHAASPYVTDFLRENTNVYESFEEGIGNAFSLGEEADARDPAGQRMLIEELQLPEFLRKNLLENNNGQVYEFLQAETFSQYIARFLADSILRAVSFLILFAAVFAAIKVLTVWLDLVAKLPILSGLNQIAGALLGGAEALLFLWIAGLLLTILAGTGGGQMLLAQIRESAWLSFLYEHNPISILVMSVVNHIL